MIIQIRGALTFACDSRDSFLKAVACRGHRLNGIRPISVLRFFLLRFVDSRFPGNSPWT